MKSGSNFRFQQDVYKSKKVFVIERFRGEVNEMNKLLALAVFLLVLWVVLRIALALTGVFLHLIWIAAVVMTVIWIIGKIRGTK